MATLNPYLNFNGNCREAMTFYQACLGGKLSVQTFGESQMSEHVPAEMKNRVLHSSLTSGSLVLMASDTMGDVPTSGNNNTLCVVGSAKGEIETLFAKLSAGGNVTHPLKEEFFGTFGDLTDKFGMNWMFQYSPTPMG
jgi:PhnB protein